MGKMIFCKVLAIASLLSSIVVDGSQLIQNPQYAISSQSYHREDVPLSYQFSAIHPYPHDPYRPDKKAQKEHSTDLQAVNEKISQFHLNPLRYAAIQYAPLPHSGKHKHSDNEYHTSPVHLIEIGRHIYSTEVTPKKDHLEPQLIANNQQEHKQDYRSFIPEYKVEVTSPRSQNTVQANIFVTPPPNFHDDQEKSPKLLYYKNLNQNHGETLSTFDIGRQEPISEKYDINQFLPPASINEVYQPKPKSLHEQLVMEKPIQSYQHVPRLHLNIARIYSIANLPHKAPDAPSLLEKTSLLNKNLAKPPALTQAVFIPNSLDEQKTLLFPVRNQYSKQKLVYDVTK